MAVVDVAFIILMFLLGKIRFHKTVSVLWSFLHDNKSERQEITVYIQSHHVIIWYVYLIFPLSHVFQTLL